MATCDCQLTYDVVRVDMRALTSTGAQVPAAAWYTSDNIIDWDFAPEIEAGKKDVLRCGGRVKNTMQSADILTGGTLKLSFCCEDPHLEFVMAGSVGGITYNSSSPPCATGYCLPDPADQLNAVSYEIRLYLRQVSGSNTVGYKELHFYQCLPSFVSEKGGQEAYTTVDATIKTTDNPSYGTAMPNHCWRILAALP